MQGRWAIPLLVLTVAACGNAFTAATGDGGPVGPSDTGVPDDDGGTPKDAMATKDAPGVPPPLDGGGDASLLCTAACPSGFACVLGKCEDRLLANFSATQNPSGNWSFGYFVKATSTAMSTFTLYPMHGSTDGFDFWRLSASSIEPSVFHNPALTSQTLTGLTPGVVQVPIDGLVLYPSPTLASVVRWTAPVAGTVDISATFTGLGTSPVTMTVASVNVDAATVFSSPINASTTSALYTATAQKVASGDYLDFFVQFATSADDLEGATGLEVHFTLD